MHSKRFPLKLVGALVTVGLIPIVVWAGAGSPMGQTASDPWTPVSSVADCRNLATSKPTALYSEAVPDVMGGFQCKVYFGGIMGAVGMRLIDESGNFRFCGNGDEVSYRGRTVCLTDWSRQANASMNKRNQTDLPTTYDGLTAILDGDLRGYRIARKK